MKKKSMNDVFGMIRDSLSVAEQKRLAEKIMESLAIPVSGITELCGELVSDLRPGRPDCPRCKAEAALGNVVKRGKSGASQRYYCKACGKYFVATTNTAFERTRKDAGTWRRFIELTITGASLAVCCKECSLAMQTAFTWRHKVLNVFAVQQDSVKLTGNIQMDEMFVSLSYKGNHVKGAVGTKRVRKPGEDNGLPRKSFHRGTDNRSTSSKQKACVLCLVQDGGKKVFGAVPGVGAVNKEMLDVTVGKHVVKEKSNFLVDQNKSTIKYLQDNQYDFETYASNTSDNSNGHKPEVRDGLHIQHVNNLHHLLRKFLAPYCGVSSKYLANYISLFMWLRNLRATNQEKNVKKISVSRAAISDCYITRRALEAYPAVPTCAA